jgi:hypothetical protein
MVRPWQVTLAAAMVFVAAGLALVGVFASSVARYHPPTDIDDDAAAGYLLGSLAGGLCIALVIAVVLVTLGVLDLRGNKVGRILTWIAAPLTFCCQAGASMPGLRPPAETTTGAVSAIVASLTTLLQLVVVLGAVVLLALPASNAFFRRIAPATFDQAGTRSLNDQ